MKLFSEIKDWILGNKKEFWILIAILLFGAFLRLYRINEYMTFLADEGRDALVVRKLLTEADLIFVGPGTSIGTMYLGPLYYYLMAPALLLANFSPVGPAVMVALLGVATIFLVWKISREWFGKLPAFFAALLYATSSVTIIFSRSSWNPNIMPFFALLSIYSIWKVYKEQKYWWLVILGLSFAAVLQSHYLGLLLAPAIFAFWLMTIKLVKNQKTEMNRFIKFSFGGIIGFIVLMSPLILFDLKHDFRNFRAMIEFASGSKDSYSPSIQDTVSKILPIFTLVVTRLFSPKISGLGMGLAALLLIGGFFTLLKKKVIEIYMLFLWLGFGCLGLALLKQEIYDHYFGFLFPAPFLLIVGLFHYWRTNADTIVKWRRYVPWLLPLSLLVFNLLTLPTLNSPNMQYPRSVVIAEKIKEVSEGRKFHLAAIANKNNRDTFLYSLKLWGAPVTDVDVQNYDETLVDQLFVVCEKVASECDPTHDSSSWITSFGWSKIENSWEVWGVTIYKLVHSEEWLKNRN